MYAAILDGYTEVRFMYARTGGMERGGGEKTKETRKKAKREQE